MYRSDLEVFMHHTVAHGGRHRIAQKLVGRHTVRCAHPVQSVSTSCAGRHSNKFNVISSIDTICAVVPTFYYISIKKNNREYTRELLPFMTVFMVSRDRVRKVSRRHTIGSFPKKHHRNGG